MILFTGVAGSAKSTLKQWDIIIPNELIQHDLDARPIFNKYVIPALSKAKISIPNELIDSAENSLKEAIIKKFHIDNNLNFLKENNDLVKTGSTIVQK